MTVRLDQLRLDLGEPETALRRQAARRLGVPAEAIARLVVRRRGFDLRRGRAPSRVYSVEVALHGEPTAAPSGAAASAGPSAAAVRRARALPPPIVVGAGPAGLFAAWTLVEAGLEPLLLERGPALAERHRGVADLRSGRGFHPDSHFCFGAGGAGTYSDGKLYTRNRGPELDEVIARLVALGADPDIAVDAHPHIGSNRLPRLVEALCARLAAGGTTLRFETRVADFVGGQGAPLTGVVTAQGERLAGAAVILATGHGARDTYAALGAAGVPLEAKALAVGVRVEHPQALIDRIQYREFAGHPDLGPAEYSLKTRIGPRGVFSFCMCPGGYVVPAGVEAGHLATNGMSHHRRGSGFANAAFVVEVAASEFGLAAPGDLTATHGVLAGVAFQRALEARAFAAGGANYRAPATRLTDFVAGRARSSLPATSYRPGVTPADVRALLPGWLVDPLGAALQQFGAQLRGFLTAEATVLGLETLTSAPLRIPRDPVTYGAVGQPGLFPAGEGAGYAGGITSSAADGLRVGRAVLRHVYGLGPES